MSDSMYDLLFIIGVISDCIMSGSIALAVLYLIIKGKD